MYLWILRLVKYFDITCAPEELQLEIIFLLNECGIDVIEETQFTLYKCSISNYLLLKSMQLQFSIQQEYWFIIPKEANILTHIHIC